MKILNVVAVAVFAAATAASMSVAAAEVIDLDGKWLLHKDGETIAAVCTDRRG